MADLLVMFGVSAEDAAAVLTALGPSLPMLRDFRIEASSARAAPVKPKRKVSLRGSRVADAMLAELNNGGGLASHSALQSALSGAGLNPNSLSPGLTQLVRAGLVRRLPGKMAQLVSTTEK